LSTAPDRGRERKLLIQANRNGFLYVFDRTTANCCWAQKFVDKLTWATGIGKDGRPIVVPGLEPQRDGTKVLPERSGRDELAVDGAEPGRRAVLPADAGGLRDLHETAELESEADCA
jgi:glucose dehydrogenase